MAKDINASFESRKNELQSGGIINLYEVEVNSSPVTYEYWCEYNASISYFKPNTVTPQTYMPAPIARGPIEQDDGTKVPSLSLGIGAADQTITAYIENNDALRGNKVSMITVPYDELNNATACLVDTYYVDSAIIDHDKETAVFDLTSKGAVTSITVPLRRMRRDQCSWRYVGNKGYNATQLALTECKCAIADSQCKHTKADCASKDNVINFGAFPGIGTQRVVY